MARSRNIKPGFCQNELLVQLPFETRLMFALLPCFADREGRIEDRPQKIKMQIFPADNVDVNLMLQQLNDAGFINRYEVDNFFYIQIVNFVKHQNPHVKEAESTIPAPGKHGASTVQAPTKASASPALTFNPITDSLKEHTSNAARFDAWWKAYPKKVEKKKAREIWKRRKLDRIADQIIEDTKARPTKCKRWMDGYIPNPTTYLRGDRWNDEYETNRAKQNGTGQRETAVQARTRRNREAIQRAQAGDHGGHVAAHD
jgi:hypothetical protein